MAKLKPYPEYKDSGVPWLGEVPEHWQTEKAKWLFERMRRPSEPGEEVVTCFRDGTVTLRKNRRTEGFTESLKEIGYQGVRKGDLVIHAMDAFAGAIGVSDSDGKCTPVYAVCKPRVEVDPHYYAYVIREMARSQYILSLARGIRERSTDFRYNAFAQESLPVPSPSEQRIIASFLARQDRAIRRYIRAKRRLIELLNEQKQAIIQRAVTRGLDPNVRLKPSGIDWLGDVPEHWQVAPLARFATEWCDGPFGSGLKSIHYRHEGVRVVRLQNIGMAKFQDERTAYISHAHYALLGHHDVLSGDLLVAGLGEDRIPSGRACVAPVGIEPAMVKADCFRFRLDRDRLIPEFAAYQMSATARTASAFLSTGATRQRVNLSSTSRRAVVVPPPSEQKAIVTYITDAAIPLEAAILSSHREIDFIREYRTRLIADVVTGKLDVRDVELPALEEPEEELIAEEDATGDAVEPDAELETAKEHIDVTN